MRTNPRLALAGPLVLGVLTTGPLRAAAEDCTPTTPVFSPGVWRAASLEMGGTVDDGISTLVTNATGSFALTVDRHGAASGGLTLEGVAGAVMDDASNTSEMTASFTVDASLGGTGAAVQADGDFTSAISGTIDVSGSTEASSFEEYGANEHHRRRLCLGPVPQRPCSGPSARRAQRSARPALRPLGADAPR